MSAAPFLLDSYLASIYLSFIYLFDSEFLPPRARLHMRGFLVKKYPQVWAVVGLLRPLAYRASVPDLQGPELWET